jgi:hypothetical protein
MGLSVSLEISVCAAFSGLRGKLEAGGARDCRIGNDIALCYRYAAFEEWPCAHSLTYQTLI